MKLRKEDLRDKFTNMMTNNQEDEQTWQDSFAEQKDKYFNTFSKTIDNIHNEKSLIANNYTEEDSNNEKLRFNI